MRINCDLGEGLTHDAELFGWIDQANIACGVHAGSATIMHRSILLSKQHGVEAGAHPSYPDREHFGRRSLPLEDAALRAWLLYQIGALDAIARTNGIRLGYVKPHGALYNDMMRDPHLFELIVSTLADLDGALAIMLQATPDNQTHLTLANRYGIETIEELFADRNYAADGSLLPRSHPEAILLDPEAIVKRIARYRREKIWYGIDGTPLSLHAQSLCIHGDHPHAVEIARSLQALFEDDNG
jgi:UPF0271 protein